MGRSIPTVTVSPRGRFQRKALASLRHPPLHPQPCAPSLCEELIIMELNELGRLGLGL